VEPKSSSGDAQGSVVCSSTRPVASLDVVVVDGYGRLSPNRNELDAILGHLTTAI